MELALLKLFFPENMSHAIAIDEVSLTRGELYNIVRSRTRSGRKGKLIAVVAGTKADDLIAVLSKLPKAQLDAVQEVTLDMSPSMRRGHAESTYRQALERNRQGKQIHTPGPQGWQRIQSQNLQKRGHPKTTAGTF